MNKIKTAMLGLIASSLIVTGVSAQGLLGERYAGVDVGWERLSNGDSENGWGVGGEVNFPLTQGLAEVEWDFNARADYVRITSDIDSIGLAGQFRGIMPVNGFKPYGGAGLGWTRWDLGGGSENTLTIPLEIGIEIPAGAVALIPFFNYAVNLDSDWDDFWTIGLRGVFWADFNWAVIGSVAYTDYDEVFGIGDSIDGLGIRVGVIFTY